MLIDTHCHLDFDVLTADRAGILERAKAAGVGRLITISTHKSRFATYRAIADEYSHIFCTQGVHPLHTHEEGEDVSADELIAAINMHPKVVGIGETGLDYYYSRKTIEVQKRSFTQHIIAAQETGLPLIIHNRDSDDDMAAMLRAVYKEKPLTGLLHCFASSSALAQAALDIGFYVSFSGIVTFKNATEIQDVAKSAPLDRILVETDAPYLAPVPMRGKTNEPSYVAHTAQFVADLRGISAEDVATQTTANARRIFTRLN